MEMIVNRVERHIINKNHKLYEIIDDLSFKSKNLYNYGNYMIRQTFIITSKEKEAKEITDSEKEFLKWINIKVDEFNNYKENNLSKKQAKGKDSDKKFELLEYFYKEHKYLGYDFLQFIIKDTDPYRALMAQTSQQTLRILDKCWKSFFQSIKDWSKNKEKYKGMPKLPKYKHKTKGRFNIFFTNQNCKLVKDKLQFPECMNKYLLTTKIKGQLQQVRIKPLGSQYLLEIVYKKNIDEINSESKRICSIDLGIDNFATLTNNIGEKPIVINGRIIKSINQYYNKQLAEYKSILKTNNDKDWSKRLQKITNKRNNRIEDFIHKASKWVVNHCIEKEIDTIVIGKNEGWKQKISIGSVNNQNFVQIPYTVFINKLKYKCEDRGIKLIVTEESYTSKASFLDNDNTPNFKEEKKEYVFSGKRTKRGLYQSKEGILINADVNGSYNIGKKVFPNIFINGIEGVGLHPTRLNIA